MNWILKNSGRCPWPVGLQWTYVEESDLRQSDEQIVLESSVAPSEEITITASFLAPSNAGTFESTWQLVDGEDEPFGPPITFTVGTYAITPTRSPLTLNEVEDKGGGVYLATWNFSETLDQDEYFAVRFWAADKPEDKHSLTWTKDQQYQLAVNNEHFPEGLYYLNVAIVSDWGLPGGNDGSWTLVYETLPKPVNVPYIPPTIPKGDVTPPPD